MRQRGRLLAHIQNTHHQCHLPEPTRKIIYRSNRGGIADRFLDKSVHRSVEIDFELVAHYDRLIRSLELYLVRSAKEHNPDRFHRLRSLPGIVSLLTTGGLISVPLTEYAIRWLNSLMRIIDCPYVFARLDKRDRWREPDGPFDRGRKAAGLEWVGFHDLRHFRATQRVMRGVDLRTVQELLGHASITTTMRYAHYAPDHATRAVHQAERLEAAELERAKSGRTGEQVK